MPDEILHCPAGTHDLEGERPKKKAARQRMRLDAAFETLAFLELYFDKHFFSASLPETLEGASASNSDLDGNSEGSYEHGNGEGKDKEAGLLFGFDEEMFGSDEDADWKAPLFKNILSGIRDLVEVGGTFYSDRFVTQCIDTAEKVRAKTGLSSESIWNHVYWSVPVDEGVLEEYRKNRHNPQARYWWTAGDENSSNGLAFTDDEDDGEDDDVEDSSVSENRKFKLSRGVSPITKFQSISSRKFSVSSIVNVDGDRVMSSLSRFISSLEQDVGLRDRIEVDLYATPFGGESGDQIVQ